MALFRSTHSASVAMDPDPCKTPLTTSLVPQVVRRMTTGLIDGKAKDGKTEEGKVTGVQLVYHQRKVFPKLAYIVARVSAIPFHKAAWD